MDQIQQTTTPSQGLATENNQPVENVEANAPVQSPTDNQQVSEPENSTPPQPEQSTPASSETTDKTLLETEKPSLIEKVNKHIRMTSELTSLFVVILLLINGLLIYLTNKQVQQYRFNRQQIAAALYNSSDIQNTVDFLETQKQQTQIINQALPKEQDFIEFIQTLELIAGEAATNSQFSFDQVKDNKGVKFVPVKITMTTTNAGFQAFLAKAEKLPYLFQINEIEATWQNDQDIWQYRLTGLVYVNSKFR